MRTIGIIAEYNPFHSGHRHHLDSLRQAFPDCALVCAMSGNFVQRGFAALSDIWTRTRLALLGGADLILELPTPWAISSAEAFARGGVALLDATGVVDTLSFGSEAGELPPLEAAATALDSPPWREALGGYLAQGLPFPAARQKAAADCLGQGADCLSTPNNSLGVEYIRALGALGSSIRPHTIPRLGAAHDGTEEHGVHRSASQLRQALLAGSDASLSPFLTHQSEELLRKNPASLSFCTRAVLARLRGMTEEEFAKLPDCGEGLSGLLCRAAQQATYLDALYSLVKSKRYTHARIRRLVLWAFLGLTAADRPETPPYLRVLGFSPKGQALLRQMKDRATLPILVKPAHITRLSPEAQQLFQKEARCTGFYGLCQRELGAISQESEYRAGPVILP